jgi:tetrahydromethanopterin S-methyltransferase subunit E
MSLANDQRSHLTRVHGEVFSSLLPFNEAPLSTSPTIVASLQPTTLFTARLKPIDLLHHAYGVSSSMARYLSSYTATRNAQNIYIDVRYSHRLTKIQCGLDASSAAQYLAVLSRRLVKELQYYESIKTTSSVS